MREEGSEGEKVEEKGGGGRKGRRTEGRGQGKDRGERVEKGRGAEGRCYGRRVKGAGREIKEGKEAR
jgi:hypothetical protein